MDIKIVCGKDLLAMDLSGKSDPYVEAYYASELLHKTGKKKNTLNPEWNEQFTFQETGLSDRIIFKVSDRDFPRDDFMGECELDLSSVKKNTSEEFTLYLKPGDDAKLIKKVEVKNKNLGYIIVRAARSDTVDEEADSAVRSFIENVSNSPKKSSRAFSSDMSKPTGLVHIVLVQARGLIPLAAGDTINAFCKVSLGSKKSKSNIYHDSLNPKWREGVNLPWFRGQDDFVEIFIHDFKQGKDKTEQQVGRAFINLRELELERSHNMWVPIKDRLEGAVSLDSHDSGIFGETNDSFLNIEREGELNIIVTISGLVETGEEISKDEDESKLLERFALSNTFSNLTDVGQLQVKVFKAEGVSPEYVFNRNPFVVLEVNNKRVQTTSSKGTTPEWNKTFQFDIKDVYEVLEVTVYDDNGDNNYEFLGKIHIPLLNVENGKERWYRLKDQTMRKTAKGDAPRILLEMKFQFNIIRASSCVFKPKIIKYEANENQEFEFVKFKLNAQRVNIIKEKVLLRKQFLINIFEWHDPFFSFCCLILFSGIIWNFDTWMVPFGIVFFLTMKIMKPSQYSNPSYNNLPSVDDDDIEEVPEQAEGDLSMMQMINRLQQRALWMQIGLGQLANALESVENVFNFTVPCISWFIYLFFMFVTIILYFIPLRILILIWVINKFRKGFIKKKGTNELVNFLARVPDNEELKNYEELLGEGENSPKTLFNLKRRGQKDSHII